MSLPVNRSRLRPYDYRSRLRRHRPVRPAHTAAPRCSPRVQPEVSPDASSSSVNPNLPAADLALDTYSFIRKHFQFDPDPKQTEALTARSPRLLICCTRQWGKSTTAAALAAARAILEPNSLILCFAPTLRQSAEFVNKVRHFLDLSQTPVLGGSLALRLRNGSRVVGLPGKEANVRGFSAPSLIVIDEAARVADELYQAIRPMLAVSQGDLALLSTPFGERGFFWKEWTSTDTPWTRIEVRATDCPRIPEAFLEEERRTQPKAWFEQEYLCSFTGSENLVFQQQWFDDAEQQGRHAFTPLRFELKGRVR